MNIQKQNPHRIPNAKIEYIIVGIIFLLVGSVWMFTRPAFADALSDKGTIGDAIGGITAPIVNLIGATLVYFSFLAQVKANNMQWEQLREEKERNKQERTYNEFMQTLKEIKQDTSNFKFTISEKSRKSWLGNKGHVIQEPLTYTFHGAEAMDEFIKNIHDAIEKGKFGFIEEIIYVIANMRDLLDNICKNNVLSDSEKSELILKTWRFYRAMYYSFFTQYENVITQVKSGSDGSSSYDVLVEYKKIMDGLTKSLESALLLASEIVDKMKSK